MGDALVRKRMRLCRKSRELVLACNAFCIPVLAHSCTAGHDLDVNTHFSASGADCALMYITRAQDPGPKAQQRK
eukprot:2179952-Pleurochrysis_carterae.AAC.4